MISVIKSRTLNSQARGLGRLPGRERFWEKERRNYQPGTERKQEVQDGIEVN